MVNYYKEDSLGMKKNIRKNITGMRYEHLLNWMEDSAAIFSFVTRKDIGISKNSENLIEKLGRFLIDSYPTNNWLSTEIIDNPIIGHIYFYEFNEETKEILLEISNSLFDWGDDSISDLPEDIAFYNNERSPILYVIGHENEAIMTISSIKDYFKLTFL